MGALARSLSALLTLAVAIPSLAFANDLKVSHETSTDGLGHFTVLVTVRNNGLPHCVKVEGRAGHNTQDVTTSPAEKQLGTGEDWTWTIEGSFAAGASSGSIRYKTLWVGKNLAPEWIFAGGAVSGGECSLPLDPVEEEFAASVGPTEAPGVTPALTMLASLLLVAAGALMLRRRRMGVGA